MRSLLAMKKRVKESWPTRQIPDDLFPEIFCSLPVKSLARFRSVSKSWLALIDDPKFVRLHLTLSKNNLHQTHLLVSQGKTAAEECVVRCSDTFQVTATLTLPPKPFTIISSMDGLVMLKEINEGPLLSTQDLTLWNPSIRKTRVLPPSPQIPSGVRTYDIGLGFDLSAKDYKHVRIVGDLCNLLSAVVYTVGTNSWKTIQLQGSNNSGWDYIFAPPKSVYFKGVMNLIAWDRTSASNRLVSMDLSTDEFTCTNLPGDHGLESSYSYHRWLTLADGGSSLAMVTLWQATGSLWVLGSESMIWTKRYIFSSWIPRLSESYVVDFLYVKKNGDMLLRCNTKLVTCYDSRAHEEKILHTRNVDDYTVTIHPYMESLVLLK